MERIFAQPLTIGDPGSTIPIAGPEKFAFGTIGQLVQKTIPLVFAFAGFGLLLIIIAAGFSLMTSAGDAKKLEAGKQQLTMGILGFVIIFTAYWLVLILAKIFGLENVTEGIFTNSAPNMPR